MPADELLVRVALGDQRAFEELYALVSGPVYGLVRRVVRDPAQSEEVAQEALLDVWRSAARFDPGRGSALSWVLTLAHRRAVDRVRSARAAGERERREALRARPRLRPSRGRGRGGPRTRVGAPLPGPSHRPPAAVRHPRLLRGLHQPRGRRTAVPAPGTVKTRMRDGLTRLRACLGGAA